MTNNEVNKVIAEYMGEKEYLEYLRLSRMDFDTESLTADLMLWARLNMLYSHRKLFTESLDALVPVWDKLYEDDCYIYEHTFTLNHDDTYSFYFRGFSDELDGELSVQRNRVIGKTLPLAASHATAMVIIQLKEK
jgi:hypothetical protein